ncbi:MAG: ribosome-binding factor A [Bacteroidota bacterium]
MKKDRIPKLLKTQIATYIHQNLPVSNIGALVTITDIKVSANLSLAKIHLSFMPINHAKNQKYFLNQIENQKAEIKKHLARTLGYTLRTIPELLFYIDDTAQKAVEMERILSKIN